MSQSNPKFDIATTITNHILDSNMPQSVKEYILSKAVFEDYTLKDKEEEMSRAKVIPISDHGSYVRAEKRCPVKSVKKERGFTHRQAEDFIEMWLGYRPHGKSRNVMVRLFVRHLKALNGVELQKLDYETVMSFPEAGKKTWLHIREMQENMKV
tara:strand:- start:486 stop:947 length:462 start_codon:yes stop_codon:yes gene_type:complete